MHDIESFEAIARRRRSVRGYRPEPVDRERIAWALNMAATAPSSCNTQPWSLHVVSGDVLARLAGALTRAAASGENVKRDIDYSTRYEGEMRERQVDAAVRLFSAEAVDRNDRKAREKSFLRNFNFFGAPHAALIFIPPGGGLREAADCGKFVQTFMLALGAAGIGSCAQGSLSRHPEIVREILKLDEPGRLLLGISFGYPDEGHPTSEVRPPREPLDRFASFHG